MIRKIISSILLLLFANSYLLAQGTIVRGEVLDAEGVPLPGVSVVIKNTTQGGLTSIDGKYAIANVSPTDTIVFSYVGFESQSFLVGDRIQIDVILLESLSELEEVTVVAFQSQKKESVMSSITSINAKELKVPQANLTSALGGRMAGIISYQRSGEPGRDNADFFIRGVTTFGYKSSPLILIDGLEVSTEDLARLEPDNIEQFSLLKDAAATALYGARGANGVVLITTKTGRKGKMTINARIETSTATPTKLNKFVDGVTYMEMYNKALRTRNSGMPLVYSKDKIEGTRRGDNPQYYPNVNWYNELFYNHAQNYKATVTASGGGDIARYYLSVAYTNEQGVLKVDPLNNFNNNININRYNIRANVDFNLTKTTAASIKMYSLLDRYNGPVQEASNIFYQVMEANPVSFLKYYDKTDKYQYVNHTLFGNSGSSQASKSNPYAEMVSGYKDRFSSNTTASFHLEQDLHMITKGLKARALASIGVYSVYNTDRQFTPFYYGMNEIPTESGVIYELNQITEGDETLGTSSYSNSYSNTYFQGNIDYNRTFDYLHDIQSTLVTYARESLNEVGGSGVYASLPARNLGLSGRLSYGYDRRYYLEGNFGYNGSEKFYDKYRWGFFPSVSGGWIASNEHFYGDNLKKTLSFLKLKFSYGLVGNDDISSPDDRFFYLSNVNTNDGGKSYVFGHDFNNLYNGYTISRYANPNIRWEVSRQANYGIEFGLFENNPFQRFLIQVDYFTQKRENIFWHLNEIPSTMGLTANVASNIGKVDSKGLEVQFDFNWSINKDFWITARANYTYATNKVIENGDPVYKYDYLNKIGHPINQQWGLVAERLFIDEYDRINSPDQFGAQSSGSYLPGDLKYVDINKDGKIDDDDRVAIGFPTVPEVVYGFGPSMGWKNIDFSFFFQGTGRTSFFIDPAKIMPFRNYRNALTFITEDYWSDDNPNPHAAWPRLSTQQVENNERLSTWWIRDGSFLRLKSVELGYSLPSATISKLHLNTARIYFSGTNLFYISKFKLWDPEMGDNGLGYPTQRVFNIGLNLSF